MIGSPSGSAYAASKFALEGWMESLAGGVQPFGIGTMIVEPGFFRTELLTPESTTFGELSIDDYDEARAQVNAFWASMNGTQAGDPTRLARALVQLADSAEPPLRWAAGEGRGRGRRGQGAAAARPGRRAPRAVDEPGPRGREGGRLMRGAVMHSPGEVRVEEREAPQIVEPTDAIIRVSAACVCGSDLWPYRGIGVEDSCGRCRWAASFRRHRRRRRRRRDNSQARPVRRRVVLGHRQHLRDLPRPSGHR